MASGLPDYFRNVRPTYGGAQHIEKTVTVNADAETTILSVSGKGIIYGGIVVTRHDSTQRNGRPTLYVDDIQLACTLFFTLYDYKILSPSCMSFYLLQFDDKRYLYSAGIAPGYTFENQVKITYREYDGTTPDIEGSLDYALIT